MASPQPVIRADVDPKHYLRFLLIGFVAVGFALWCLYDGAIAYPAKRAQWLEHQKLEEEGREKKWSERELQEAWRALARERGWPTIPPEEETTEGDMMFQYVMAAMACGIGLTFLTVWFRARGRWIEAGASGVRTSWGQSFEFDQVVQVDKKRWRNKGIARVTYMDANRKRRFIVDDYKFHRHPTDAILYQLETKIDPQMIVGGPPEPSPEEASADDEQPAEAEAGQGD